MATELNARSRETSLLAARRRDNLEVLVDDGGSALMTGEDYILMTDAAGKILLSGKHLMTTLALQSRKREVQLVATAKIA